MPACRFLCSLLAASLLVLPAAPSSPAAEDVLVSGKGVPAADTAPAGKTRDIRIRDPFVLVYDRHYYMYGTGAAPGPGYGCYVSADLENWTGPFSVFAADAGFDGSGNFWAPECHFYQGAFYLFATYFSRTTGRRGVSVFRSGSPLGPFEEVSAGHVTPKDWDCIDGTLYIDPAGRPWMIFVHEWTSMADKNGAMAAARLTDDLTRFIGEPVELFKAKDPVWAKNGVTDGPCLYRTKTGALLMLWSNFDSGGYCVALSSPANGQLAGDWNHGLAPFYARGDRFAYDGGHPMLFTDLDGRLMMSIHSPNAGGEHAVFLEVIDEGGTLRLKDGDKQPGLPAGLRRLRAAFTFALSGMLERFKDVLS
ncbi:MAG TPA: glycoside hydrolase family 43 protein [Clostridiales bacterium]|nr:MAG: Extracellular exo-alpha-(1->5)-L-arabinofuranosidase ArbA precursor [Firmicutes bacterium ADurb.Bin262]HOU09293.1 glycoside hydrolase family 43 protein [Clostridiales bacterium]HQK73431.1 glycoside hydrolase family 43 protein [Clostridiales bacterium]